MMFIAPVPIGEASVDNSSTAGHRGPGADNPWGAKIPWLDDALRDRKRLAGVVSTGQPCRRARL
jgi:hypothetical protein